MKNCINFIDCCYFKINRQFEDIIFHLFYFFLQEKGADIKAKNNVCYLIQILYYIGFGFVFKI